MKVKYRVRLQFIKWLFLLWGFLAALIVGWFVTLHIAKYIASLILNALLS